MRRICSTPAWLRGRLPEEAGGKEKAAFPGGKAAVGKLIVRQEFLVLTRPGKEAVVGFQHQCGQALAVDILGLSAQAFGIARIVVAEAAVRLLAAENGIAESLVGQGLYIPMAVHGRLHAVIVHVKVALDVLLEPCPIQGLDVVRNQSSPLRAALSEPLPVICRRAPRPPGRTGFSPFSLVGNRPVRHRSSCGSTWRGLAQGGADLAQA